MQDARKERERLTSGPGVTVTVVGSAGLVASTVLFFRQREAGCGDTPACSSTLGPDWQLYAGFGVGSATLIGLGVGMLTKYNRAKEPLDMELYNLKNRKRELERRVSYDFSLGPNRAMATLRLSF